MKYFSVIVIFCIFQLTTFSLSHFENTPVDIYIFDTKIDKNSLLKDFQNANLIKYDESLMQLIYTRANMFFNHIESGLLSHGTDLTSLILEQVGLLNDITIYDIPIASSESNGKKVDENLLFAALYEVGAKIIKSKNQSARHSIFVLSISIPLSQVPSGDGALLLGKMTQIISTLIANNVHILVAAGNEKIPVNEAWPSSIDDVYSIGGLMSHKLLSKKSLFKCHNYERYSYSNFNAEFYDLASNVSIKRARKTESRNGTSFANAIVAGKLAFILSKIDKSIHPRDTLGTIIKKKFIYDMNGELPMLPSEVHH